jgi:hypothetical protein
VQGRVAGLARRLGFSRLYRRLLAKETRKLVALAVEARQPAGEGSPS